MDRRRFLILSGSAAVALAIAPHVSWARRIPSGAPSLQPWKLPEQVNGNPADVARALIGAAVLAPSYWNTQPWRFESEQNVIRIVADVQRTLSRSDPDRRNLYLSLGAALENLLVTARAYGLHTSVSYLPESAAPGTAAAVTWMNGETRRDRTLFGAIPERRTNHRDFDGRGIFMPNRAQLTAQIPDDVRLHWLDDGDRIRDVSDIAYESVKSTVLDPGTEAERYAWTRFDDGEARRRGDGVGADDIAGGGPRHWLARRYLNPRSWFLRFGAEGAAKRARSQLRSAGALALFSTPRGGPAQWLVAGQAYERFALTATALGIAQQPMSEPLEREADRTQLMHQFGAQGEQPLMLVRLGHAKQPSATVRRSVPLVASFKTS